MDTRPCLILGANQQVAVPQSLGFMLQKGGYAVVQNGPPPTARGKSLSASPGGHPQT